MLSEGPARSLDTRRLLAIDVEAEVRKLAGAQLEGVWQVPAELVRALLQAGARRVRVGIRGSGFTVESDRPLAAELARHLATLRARDASAAARHRALVALEQHGALALIVLAGLAADTSIGEAGTRIEVRRLRIPVERARRFLEGACRFAPAALVIEGRPAARGFDRALAEAELAPPLVGRLAIPARGEAGRVWLLLHGVSGAHLTVPGVPGFEAALEMRDLVGPLPSAAALREAAAPLVPALTEQAHRLTLALGARIRERSHGEQRRVRQLLLATAADPRHASAVFPLPILRAVTGPRAESHWLSLRDLAALAANSRAPVPALDPGQEPAAFLLPATPVLLLDGPERSRVGALLGLHFAPPPRRPAASPLRRLLALALERAGTGLRALAHRAAHPRRREEVPYERLTPAERALLASLWSQIASGSGQGALAMVEGDGPVRRTRGPRWWLPRANALVVASRDAVARDPAWAYPARLALLEGAGRPSGPARALWWTREPAARAPASGGEAKDRG